MRRDVLRTFEHVAAACGPIGAFRIGPQPALLVASAEGAREVLMERAGDFGKGWLQRRSLRPVLGDGLLISEGPRHDDHRSMIGPALVAKRMPDHVPAMVEEARRSIDGWADGATIDVLDELRHLAMNIVGRLVFGQPLDDPQRFEAAVTEAFEWEMHAITRYLVPPPWVPTARNRRLAATKRFVHERIGALVDAVDEDLEVEPLITRLQQGTRRDGSRMSRHELLDEAVNLWGAAHETSADAQAWALYLLGHHPRVAARLRDEVDTVLGDRPLRADDLPDLPYALQVFKETLRLYPPAAAVVRMASRATTIGGHRVARGTLVFVVPYLVHRDPRTYDHPERFDPDRFDASLDRTRPKLAFLPFGAGRHVCVGGQLAMTEGHVLTATLAQLVQLDLVGDEPVPPELLINLRPSRPIRARVRRRSGATVGREELTAV